MQIHIRKLPGSNIEQEFYLVTEVDAAMEVLAEEFNDQAVSFQQARAKIVRLEAAVKEKENKLKEIEHYADTCLDYCESKYCPTCRKTIGFITPLGIAMRIQEQDKQIAALTAYRENNYDPAESIRLNGEIAALKAEYERKLDLEMDHRVTLSEEIARLRETLKDIVIWAEGSTCEICGKKKMTETDAYDYARKALKQTEPGGGGT